MRNESTKLAYMCSFVCRALCGHPFSVFTLTCQLVSSHTWSTIKLGVPCLRVPTYSLFVLCTVSYQYQKCFQKLLSIMLLTLTLSNTSKMDMRPPFNVVGPISTKNRMIVTGITSMLKLTETTVLQNLRRNGLWDGIISLTLVHEKTLSTTSLLGYCSFKHSHNNTTVYSCCHSGILPGNRRSSINVIVFWC